MSRSSSPSGSGLGLPVQMAKERTRWNLLFVLSSVFVLISWWAALFWVGSDVDQGEVYRIIFVHVPVAWCAFLWIIIGGIFGLMGLISKSKSEQYDRSSHSAMEIGTVFGVLALLTGSIWGRPTWGVWWDWDPRLTSTLVMVLVATGYLVLREFTPDVRNRRNVAAITAILSSVNVPIVYFSVNLWRSIHQPQTFTRGNNLASSDITTVLWLNVFALVLLSITIFKIRRQAITSRELLHHSREQQ